MNYNLVLLQLKQSLYVDPPQVPQVKSHWMHSYVLASTKVLSGHVLIHMFFILYLSHLATQLPKIGDVALVPAIGLKKKLSLQVVH